MCLCVCLCVCMHSLAHLLFKAFQVFSRFSREPQGGTALSCPAQLRGSRFLRGRGGLRAAAFPAMPSSMWLPLLHTVLFFFASFKILSGLALNGGCQPAPGEFTRRKSLQGEMSQG